MNLRDIPCRQCRQKGSLRIHMSTEAYAAAEDVELTFNKGKVMLPGWMPGADFEVQPKTRDVHFYSIECLNCLWRQDIGEENKAADNGAYATEAILQDLVDEAVKREKELDPNYAVRQLAPQEETQ